MDLILIGLLWFLIATLISLYIQSDIFDKKSGMRIGFILIVLSFVSGFILLGLALVSA